MNVETEASPLLMERIRRPGLPHAQCIALDLFAQKRWENELDQKIQNIYMHIDWLKRLVEDVSGLESDSSRMRALPSDDFCHGAYGNFLREHPQYNLQHLQHEQEALVQQLVARRSESCVAREALSARPRLFWEERSKAINFARSLAVSKGFLSRLIAFFQRTQQEHSACGSPFALRQLRVFVLECQASDYFMLRSFVEAVYGKLKDILCQAPLFQLERLRVPFAVWLKKQQNIPVSLVACCAHLMDEILFVRRDLEFSDSDDGIEMGTQPLLMTQEMPFSDMCCNLEERETIEGESLCHREELHPDVSCCSSEELVPCSEATSRSQSPNESVAKVVRRFLCCASNSIE